MGCFSLAWFGSVLIWLIVIGAIVALVRLLLPMALAQLGSPAGVIMGVINIILYAVIAIFVVYFAIDLIECAVGAGGIRLPHR